MTDTAPGLGGRTRWDGLCRRGRGCDLVDFMHLAWKHIHMPRENETAKTRLWLGGVYAVCIKFTRKPHDSYRRQFRHHLLCPFSRTFSSGLLPPPPSRARARVCVCISFSLSNYIHCMCVKEFDSAQVHHGLVAASALFMIIIGIIACVTFLGAVSPLCLLYCTDSVPRY